MPVSSELFAPDLILVNAAIHTMDERCPRRRPWQSAMAKSSP